MDRLILFRHGKAEPDSDSGDDFDRRLAPRGVEESAEMGAHLASLGFSPDLVLVSPAARTRETWASMQGAFPSAQSRVEEHLYHADSVTIRRSAQTAREGRGIVMVVGHNPGLQELTIKLLQEGGAPQTLIARAQRNFPPAAAAVFLFDDNGRPHYDGLFFPGRHH
ncbi:MAG: histidine phosphatase family protein [Phenylobacterium sp.]|uniref:SixA phosphatase family protein n=1 Tax=Phenylobacterium sp. TaxID=1871053 RepID=UPI001A559BD5|nr:histidine phosphatase family protein [Phenylobacterium sp.]MBL8773060.1 histidine phosphatase family protein [Phenylobacterium sp.]